MCTRRGTEGQSHLNKVTQLGSGERQGLNPEYIFFSYFYLLIFALGIDWYPGFSLVAEWRLLCLGGQTSRGWAQDFGSRTAGSVVVSYGLHCSEAGGIFPDRIEPMSPALAGGFFTTKPPGSTLLITILPAS